MPFAKTLLALSLSFALAPVALADTGLDADDLATARDLRERALAGSQAWSVVESLTTEVGPRRPAPATTTGTKRLRARAWPCPDLPPSPRPSSSSACSTARP